MLQYAQNGGNYPVDDLSTSSIYRNFHVWKTHRSESSLQMWCWQKPQQHRQTPCRRTGVWRVGADHQSVAAYHRKCFICMKKDLNMQLTSHWALVIQTKLSMVCEEGTGVEGLEHTTTAWGNSLQISDSDIQQQHELHWCRHAQH